MVAKPPKAEVLADWWWRKPWSSHNHVLRSLRKEGQPEVFKTQREHEGWRGRGAHVKRSERKNEETGYQTSPHLAY